MRNWFNELDLAQECDELDVEGMWQTFFSLIDQAVNMFVPVGYNKSMNNPRWMNRVAKSAQIYKSRMWVRYRQYRSNNDLIEYKIAQNNAVKKKKQRQF